MKRLIILIVIALAGLLLPTVPVYAQQGIECLNCCGTLPPTPGSSTGPCRVMCTEKPYQMMVPRGPAGCVFPTQPGYTATLISSTPSNCLFEIVFSAPGTYNIANNCFVVLPHPQAIITNPGPIQVCKGAQVDFFNGSVNATVYSWDFGDPSSMSNTSTAAGNPVSHTYLNAGTYTVTLIASAGINSANGTHVCCSDTTQITVIVDSGAAPTVECLSPVCDNTPGTYCITSSPPGCTYTWSTNPPNTVTSSGNCATFNWTSEPFGSIILTPSGANCCPFPTTFTIPIMPSGTFNITGSNIVCGGAMTYYSAPAIWGATYNWSISPALSFNIPNPANPSQIEVLWPSSGTYTITCNMGNDVLDCEAVGTITVNIQPQFQISGPTDTCVNQPVTFTSTAPGTTWTPVTGCTPSGNNFNCTFTTPGTYTITASAPGYCNTPSTTITILPQPPAPTISGPLQVLPGCTYTYTATGSGSMTWTVLPAAATVINAGNSIQVTWPTNFTLGSVSVSTSSGGCPSVPAVVNVDTIPKPTITAATNLCSNGQNTFSISSLPPNCTVNWTVSPVAAGSITAGQGTSSVTVDWYTVTSSTSVTVTATITNSCTNLPFATLSSTGTLFPEPIASISGNLLFCTGSSTTITATPGFSNYSWDGTNTVANTFSFNTAGQHWVEVTNASGCKKKIYFTLVQVPGPTVTLSTQAPATCNGTQLNPFTLVTTVAPGYTVTNYTFKDPSNNILCTGLTPNCNVTGSPASGTYTVSVTFNYTYNGSPVSCTRTAGITLNCDTDSSVGVGCNKNPLNCQYGITYTNLSCNTIQLTINANPPCGSFTNPDNINLNWGDGNNVDIFSSYNSSTQTYTLTHTYGLPGVYHLFLACNLGSISIPVGGVVDFALVQDSCAVDLLDFSSAISGASFVLDDIDWGDATVNTLNTHSYAASGTYNVTVTYLLNGSPCSTTKSITIVKPNFSINAMPNPACVNAPVSFSVNYMGSFNSSHVASYDWDFGDLSLHSHDSVTTHSYTTAGTYNVILTIKDIYGCEVKDTLTLTVNPAVAYTLTNNGPQCDSVIITVNTPSGFGNPTSVTWTPASVNSIGGFQYSVDSSGLYTAVVTGPNGCSVTLSQNIVVMPPPNVQLLAPDTMCTGQKDTIVTSASPSQFSINWQINGISLAYSQSGTNVGIAFAPTAAGTYEVVLTVTALAAPFCSATLRDTITVFASPSVSVTPSTFGFVCAGNPITLTANPSGGTPGYTYSWSNAQTVNPITVMVNGTYTVTITDANGCKAVGSAPANIAPLPDFTVFARGCDTLCFGKNDTLHGPAGYANYNFLIDGVTVQNGASSLLINPCGLPAMADGAPHIIKLIITTNMGCVDSAQFQLKCKDCSSCACDSNIFFTTSPYVSYTAGEQKKTDSTKCNSSEQTLELRCKVPYQFAIGFNIPAGYDSCKIADSVVIMDGAGNVVASQASVSPTNPLNYTFTQSGKYCITHFLTVNGKVCKVCRFCVNVSCPNPPPCTTCPTMLNSILFELDSLQSQNGYHLQTGNLSFTTANAFEEVRISIADIEYSWSDDKCMDCKMQPIGRGCLYAQSATQTIGSLILDPNSAQFLPVGSKPGECPEEVKWIPGTAAAANSYNVPLQVTVPPSLIPSCCSLKITKLCLRFSIKDQNCQVCDTVICLTVRPECCKGGKWVNKTMSTPQTETTHQVQCGKTYNIADGVSYTFNADYLCNSDPKCQKKVRIGIKQPNGTVNLYNAPTTKTFTQAGTYTVTYYAYCGNSICDSCVFYMYMEKDCCKKSKWITKKITTKKVNGQPTTANLNTGSNYSSNGMATVELNFNCAEECKPTYSWKRWRKGAFLDSAYISTASAPTYINFMPPSSGCDSIVITAYCDGKPCDVISFKLCCLVCLVEPNPGGGTGTGSNLQLKETDINMMDKQKGYSLYGYVNYQRWDIDKY